MCYVFSLNCLFSFVSIVDLTLECLPVGVYYLECHIQNFNV